MTSLRKRWHRYHYKNLTYVVFCFLFSLILLKVPQFKSFLLSLGSYGYLGAFVGGALFVSTFTVSLGSVILLFLAESLKPIEIGLFAGVGAVVGDMVIFNLIRNRGLISEIRHFFEYWGGDDISKLIHTKYFSWTLPVIGALIIASPLPDELGVGLMGISKMKTQNFILLSFVLNSIGILAVISASYMFRP